MRYIPSSRYTLDEIADQCRNAILKSAPVQCDLYAEVRKYFRYNLELNHPAIR